jgi:hypothetical protein
MGLQNKGIVDLKEYVEKTFCPLDIFGTTDFHPVARIIWKETWYRGKWNWFLVPYKKRAHLSTHIAVAVLGKDGRKWIMEMDHTKLRDRYVSTDGSNCILSQEEWVCFSEKDRKSFRKIQVTSGLILSPLEKYMTTNPKDAHVCWVGRSLGIRNGQMRNRANELMFEYYRMGVNYDYKDLFSFPSFLQKAKIHGSEDVLICSELPQRIFQHLGILNNIEKPMSPMDWQVDRKITYPIRETTV